MSKKLEMSAAEESAAQIPAGEVEAGVEPVAPRTMSPEALRDWLDGVTEAKVSVMLYQVGDQTDLNDAISEMQTAKITNDRLGLARWSKARDMILKGMRDSAIRVVIKGWTARRQDEFKKQLDEDGVTSNLERNLAQVAAQIVEPLGLDVEFLREFHDSTGFGQRQVDRLVRATVLANSESEPVTVPL